MLNGQQASSTKNFNAKKFWEKILGSAKSNSDKEKPLTQEQIVKVVKQVSQLTIEAFEQDNKEKEKLTLSEVAKILLASPDMSFNKGIILNIKIHLNELNKLVLLRELLKEENTEIFSREGFFFLYLVNLMNRNNCSNLDDALRTMYENAYPRIFDGKPLRETKAQKSNDGFFSHVLEAFKKKPEPTPELTDTFVISLLKKLFEELLSDNDAMLFIYKIMKGVNFALKQNPDLAEADRKVRLLDVLNMYVFFPNKLISSLITAFPDDNAQRKAIPINAGRRIKTAIRNLAEGKEDPIAPVLTEGLDAYWSHWHSKEFEEAAMLFSSDSKPSDQLRAAVQEARGKRGHFRKRSSIGEIVISTKEAQVEIPVATPTPSEGKEPKVEPSAAVPKPSSSQPVMRTTEAVVGVNKLVKQHEQKITRSTSTAGEDKSAAHQKRSLGRYSVRDLTQVMEKKTNKVDVTTPKAEGTTPTSNNASELAPTKPPASTL